MVGEGEETFLELVKHYMNGSPSLEKTTGLVYCKPDGTIPVSYTHLLIIFKNGAEAHRLVGLTDKEELKKLLDE